MDQSPKPKCYDTLDECRAACRPVLSEKCFHDLYNLKFALVLKPISNNLHIVLKIIDINNNRVSMPISFLFAPFFIFIMFVSSFDRSSNVTLNFSISIDVLCRKCWNLDGLGPYKKFLKIPKKSQAHSCVQREDVGTL
jgi:hypothetical protein